METTNEPNMQESGSYLSSELESVYMKSWYPVYGRRQFFEWYRVHREPGDIPDPLSNRSSDIPYKKAFSVAQKRGEEFLLMADYLSFSFEDTEAWWNASKGNARVAYSWRRWGFAPEEIHKYLTVGVRAPHIAYLIKSLDIPIGVYQNWKRSTGYSNFDVYMALSGWIPALEGDLLRLDEVGLKWEISISSLPVSSVMLYREYMSDGHGYFSEHPGKALEWAREFGRTQEVVNLEMFAQLMDTPEAAKPWIESILVDKWATPYECTAYSFLRLSPEEAKKWHTGIGSFPLIRRYVESGTPLSWALEMESGRE